MKILISNDDGVDSKGIKTLANGFARIGHKIIVVAPKSQKSAFSHSLTLRKPMQYYCEHDGYDSNVEVHSIEGTPADCVKFACYMFKEKFDVVITGINDGPNLGEDILYSGTVGSATEGAINGYKAIAISLAREGAINFETAFNILKNNYEKLLTFDNVSVWNINVPDLPYDHINGVKFTRCGSVKYIDEYEKCEINGCRTYALGGKVDDVQTNDLSTDVGAVKNGWASITPLIVDRTDYEILKKL